MNNHIWLIVVLVGGFLIGVATGSAALRSDIEKSCLYKQRLEFSGQMFSCTWLEGVTENTTPIQRKPHPLAEVLK